MFTIDLDLLIIPAILLGSLTVLVWGVLGSIGFFGGL